MTPPPILNSAGRTAIQIFRQHHGLLRTGEAIRQGIHPATLYALRDAGRLEPLSRGLYRLADLPPLSNPDLTVVARRFPKAVICLISALAFHNLTDQVPHVIDIAISSHAERPVLAYPPLRVFWFSEAALQAGAEVHTIDHTPILITCPEKSLADIFKYRHKLGSDVALEALKFYLRRRRRPQVDKLLEYARVCRVEKVMRPYLEALL